MPRNLGPITSHFHHNMRYNRWIGFKCMSSSNTANRPPRGWLDFEELSQFLNPKSLYTAKGTSH